MDIGQIHPRPIEREMRESYIDFAMSVITARALPDVRDGLKPVQRRVLYAMDELGLRPNAAHKKSARIVGEVLGKYHPHSDVAVYDTMVRLAQGFAMRYPLVDGQGNFGSVDGDPPAAMRYTEARLSSIAEEMLADLDKNTIDFQPNFDGSLREPSVLPARLPSLLVNGSVGIAVGMATNVPPHNLTEVVDALVLMIARYGAAVEEGLPFGLVWSRVMRAATDEAALAAGVAAMPPELAERVRARIPHGTPPDRDALGEALLGHLDAMIDVTPADLMAHVRGPDFPTAGSILGDEGIKQAYTTGHGRIVIRAKAHTEDLKGNREAIVVTELPYQVNKATLVEKIADLVREKRIDGISDMRDESDRQGMRLVIELKRDTNVRAVLNQLFKMTAMQSAFSINMLALVDGQPRVLTLKQILLQYLNWRHQVLTRRTQFELDKARARAHILEGLKIALDHLDEVIRIIRGSADTESARRALIERFALSEIQANAILDMQLRRLAALERQKILDELAEVLGLVTRLEDLLAHPVKLLFLARDELMQLRDKFGDARRTKILVDVSGDLTAEDLVPEQDVVVLSTVRDYVRRLPGDAFRVRRSIRGVSTTISHEEDAIRHLTIANTRDTVLFFSNRGKVYAIKGHELPEQQARARGLPLSNITGITREEKVTAVLAIKGFDQAGDFIFVTRGGEVKRTAVREYASARAVGLIAMDLPPGDELVSVGYTPGGQHISIITEQGQSIRFPDANLRVASRQSGGVRGIRLEKGDHVVDANLVDPEADILVATARGFGKRVPISQFSVQGRGGGGIRVMPVTARTGPVVVARMVRLGDEVMIASREGVVVRQAVQTVPPVGRTAQGAVIIQLDPKDSVAAMARLRALDEGEEPGGPPSPPGPGGSNGPSRGPLPEVPRPPAPGTVEHDGSSGERPAGRAARRRRPAATVAAAAATPGAPRDDRSGAGQLPGAQPPAVATSGAPARPAAATAPGAAAGAPAAVGASRPAARRAAGGEPTAAARTPAVERPAGSAAATLPPATASARLDKAPGAAGRSVRARQAPAAPLAAPTSELSAMAPRAARRTGSVPAQAVAPAIPRPAGRAGTAAAGGRAGSAGRPAALASAAPAARSGKTEPVGRTGLANSPTARSARSVASAPSAATPAPAMPPTAAGKLTPAATRQGAASARTTPGARTPTAASPAASNPPPAAPAGVPSARTQSAAATRPSRVTATASTAAAKPMSGGTAPRAAGAGTAASATSRRAASPHPSTSPAAERRRGRAASTQPAAPRLAGWRPLERAGEPPGAAMRATTQDDRTADLAIPTPASTSKAPAAGRRPAPTAVQPPLPMTEAAGPIAARSARRGRRAG